LFKQSNKYNLRQTFVCMCDSLMDSKDIFIAFFLKEFVELQNDRVVNVRMALSETIASYCKRNHNGGIVYEL